MALIGRTREPAERFCVGAWHADTGRIEGAEIELRLVIAGLRRPQIAARHVLIGCRTSLRADRACQEGTAEYRQNGPLHGNALASCPKIGVSRRVVPSAPRSFVEQNWSRVQGSRNGERQRDLSHVGAFVLGVPDGTRSRQA